MENSLLAGNSERIFESHLYSNSAKFVGRTPIVKISEWDKIVFFDACCSE